ncbi:oxygen-dependent coproporphyrinogen oxidase [Rugosimonospora acidiphila]|uniref:coproporphyrinogen oxidase n=1 Tax=Rugosimonospora acidiphila TaxID=556531 RepID=A0ABP9SS03_9ACTN
MGRAETVVEFLRQEQARLVDGFERMDGRATFRQAPWSRPELGGGTARILEQGRVFERGGVNVSLVHGARVPASIADTQPELAGRPFVATGISVVLHAVNPYTPSFHANFRYFEVDGGERDGTWWFGGGADLTPCYAFEQDATHFHATLKACCDRYDPGWYPAWKQACDRYFYLPHRAEMRGVGGIFFDRLSGADGVSWQRCFDFVRDGSGVLLDAIEPIVARRRATPYGQRERQWQLLRRGRYVEFNLVYDRGTRFGLETRGNVEAILMSLPAVAGWAFDVRPEPGSPEELTVRCLQPTDWAARA